jgi:hypothetical protein
MPRFCASTLIWANGVWSSAVVVAVSGGKRKKKGEGGFGVLRFHERVA